VMTGKDDWAVVPGDSFLDSLAAQRGYLRGVLFVCFLK
jgi:hypothetical protein